MQYEFQSEFGFYPTHTIIPDPRLSRTDVWYVSSPAAHLLVDPVELVASSGSHPLDAADGRHCNHWRLKPNILGL